MKPKCLLITVPSVDFTALAGVCQHVLGHAMLPAAPVNRDLAESEKFMSCLASLRDPKAPAGFAPKLLSHVAFSVCVVADDRDLYDILECCSGMSFVTAPTTARNVSLAIISGTMAKWRDAVVSGCSRGVEPSVRAGFNALYHLFLSVNVNVWPDYRTREAADETLLLEYKPQR
jgi:hypothetical protein